MLEISPTITRLLGQSSINQLFNVDHFVNQGAVWCGPQLNEVPTNQSRLPKMKVSLMIQMPCSCI